MTIIINYRFKETCILLGIEKMRHRERTEQCLMFVKQCQPFVLHKTL